MKSYITAILVVIATVLGVQAQIVTTEPTPLQQGSENIVIYFHADQGNKGLLNQPANQPVYAHTGVLTNESASTGDWKYAPPKWGDNSEKYKLTYVSPNLWKLDMGNIRQYYGITDPNVVVTKLCFVFRNATSTKEGKTATGGDIFVDVLEEGFHVTLSADKTGSIVTDGNTTWNFTASSTSPATLSISVNGTNIATKDNVTTLTAPYTFTAKGDYTVKAVGKNASGKTEEQAIVYCYPTNSVAQNYPGGTPKMGAVRNGDGTVTFCLAAPKKTNAMLVPSWDDYSPMNKNVMKYQDVDGVRYFWITTDKALDANTQYMYYYLVDGQYRVGDPYARLVLDPFNDKYISESVYPNLPAYPVSKLNDVPLAIYHENINAYDWKVKDFVRPAKSDLIIYELLFRDFTGTESKALGDGTVRKAIEKIPYLKKLGVNAVEVLPINEFNGNVSWGYNPNFYFAPDKAYGTPDDYKEFIDECHANGIAVILDVVFNQSDWLHPWYQLYESGQNPFYNASAPHAYSVLNDWNQGYPLVQTQFKDMLQYWLKEYKVDGFRFDLVKGLGDNESYSNSGDGATNAYNASRVARMKSLQDAVTAVCPDAYFINENLAGPQEENEMAAFGQLNWSNLNNSGCQFAMGYSSDSGLNAFYAPKGDRTWGSTVSYLESHDEERLAYKQKAYGVAEVKNNVPVSMRRLGSAAAQMILAPGPHMIWQFSELGNDQTTKSSNGGNNTDPKIVNWNLTQDPDRNGLYNCYRELISIRTENPDLFTQEATFNNVCGATNWGNGRFIYASNASKELVCVINPSVSASITCYPELKSKDANAYHIVSKSYNSNPQINYATGAVTLEPNAYVVISSSNTTGIDVAESSELLPEVIGGKGRIIVNGDWADLEVYSLSGIRLNSLEVPAGIYIVRASGRTFKVSVR